MHFFVQSAILLFPVMYDIISVSSGRGKGKALLRRCNKAISKKKFLEIPT